MNLLSGGSGWQRGASFLLLVVLTLGATCLLIQVLSDEPEIALEIGGTYENMRNQSSAPFSPLIRGLWLGIPKIDARLRFIDPQYGFVTPLARFFTVGFNDDVIEDIRMSPQIEPLLLDDALKVVLDLQEQWRESGWVAVGVKNNPHIVDTPEWRARLRNSLNTSQTYWQAGDKYQVMLVMSRFKYNKRPDEERYLISLSLARPWGAFDDGFDPDQNNPVTPLLPFKTNSR
jgi:TM2 domain-containing membrane protein YozV